MDLLWVDSKIKMECKTIDFDWSCKYHNIENITFTFVINTINAGYFFTPQSKFWRKKQDGCRERRSGLPPGCQRPQVSLRTLNCVEFSAPRAAVRLWTCECDATLAPARSKARKPSPFRPNCYPESKAIQVFFLFCWMDIGSSALCIK